MVVVVVADSPTLSLSHTHSIALQQKYASVINQLGGWKWFQDLLGALHEIAEAKNTTIANVASKWVLDRPQVVGILVGARNSSHVAEHKEVSKVTLDQADLAKINAVLSQGVPPKGDCYDWERGAGPF